MKTPSLRLFKISQRVAALRDLDQEVFDVVNDLTQNLETSWTVDGDGIQVRFSLYKEGDPTLLIEAKIPANPRHPGAWLERSWPYRLQDEESAKIFDAYKKNGRPGAQQALALIGDEAWQYVRQDALQARDAQTARSRLENIARHIVESMPLKQFLEIRKKGSAEHLRKSVESLLFPEVLDRADVDQILNMIQNAE